MKIQRESTNARRPRVVDLFAGAGGLSLGAIRAGFDLALSVELDGQALLTHQRNFPAFKHLPEDIFCLDGEEIIQMLELKRGELDGLIGGPPCQGFSVMGKRDVADDRNNLFVKFFEIAAKCQPRFFLAENVLGILDKRYADTLERAFDHVKNNYVLLEPLKLKASEFGAPTSRERVFFVGYRPNSMESLTREDFDVFKVDGLVTVGEALFGLPSSINSNWLTEKESWRSVEVIEPKSPFWERVSGMRPGGVGDEEALRRYHEEKLVSGCFGTRHSPELEERYMRLKPGEKDVISRATRLRADGLCPTIRAGTGSDRGKYQALRPIHPILPRVITPREAARLQGFPDWFRFAPSKWQSFRQIGNSVSPILAEFVLSTIYSRL